MIIKPKVGFPQVTFVHIPKCAGTSVENALRKIAREKNTETGLYGYCQKMCRWMQHLTLFEMVSLSYVPVDSFIFTFIRNPFDRIVSEWRWRGKKQTFRDFVSRRNTNIDSDFIQHQTTQCDYLRVGGAIKADFIGRFENLKSDWGIACKKMGVRVELSHAMESNHDKTHYSKVYDVETRKRVEELYAEDLETFNYQYEEK